MTNQFLDDTVAVLQRTPGVLDALLRDLPESWTRVTEGSGTWSPYDVVGHLNHGERTDWIPRIAILLEHGVERPFDPFDREGQFKEGQGNTMEQRLDEFRRLRGESLASLRALQLTAEHLDLEGMHPALGRVTLRQLLATWAAHDLSHLVQIGRTMAKRNQTEVGPWAEYLSVLR